MTSIIEMLRHWAGAKDGHDTIAVRIYRNGRLVARGERHLSQYGCGVDRFDTGAFNAANNITSGLLGAARRAAKMECRNGVNMETLRRRAAK